MKRIMAVALLSGAGFALSGCGSTDDTSAEATPETVEVPAEEALEPVAEEPVEDEDAIGEPIDPAANAPDQATTERAADAAAEVAAAAEAAAAAADLPIDE